MANTDLAALVGRNIRTARKSRDMTQNDLSRELGASGAMIVSSWERGRTRPSDPHLVRLSEIFGHEPAWFFTDHEPARSAA